MLTPEQIREAIKPFCLARVAREANLPYHTVYRLVNNPEREPLFSTVAAVSKFIENR